MKSLIPLHIVAVFVLVFAPGSAASQANPDDMPWLDGFTLVVLETEDIPSLHRAREEIQARGGRICIMSPPSILMGWVPFEMRDELIGTAGIKDIFYTDVAPGEVKAEDRQTRMMLDYFNAAVRREIQMEYRAHKQAAEAEGNLIVQPDALDPPEIDEASYIENLRQAGLDIEKLREDGLLIRRSGQEVMGNSDYMTGTVALTVFFVESDGSGSDPDRYTWTEAHMQDYLNGVNTGLAWWSAQSNDYSNCWVAFFVRYYPATDPRCQQWYEPILHSSSYQQYWVNNVITNFGYTSGTYISKVTAFNTWQRSNYGTDRSYSAFVAYNPPGSPNRFTNGYAAAAYWGGPYTFLLYRSFSWAPEQVFTHETGHIFYACDEYYEEGYGGCTSCGGCRNEVDNGNCEYCNPASLPCMMKSNSFTLCSYTPGHVGWFISPCAPPPLTPPTASTCNPTSQYQGLDATITIIGSDFLYGAFVELGAGVTFNQSTLVSPETLIVEISIDNAAVPGVRNMIVKNRDLQADTIFAGFEIRPTTRHYSSPSGNNVFPYITPENAAVTISNAISAAVEGDSVLVASTTLTNISLNIAKGVGLYGGWIDNFTGRDLVSGKTVLDMTGNIVIGSTAPVVVDGFVIQNGQGSYSTQPQNGYYGGGVMIVNSEATVSNCEIHTCDAQNGGSFSAGGGIFAYNSTVDVHNNSIWGNVSEVGGGVYLYGCSGTVNDNVVSGNQLQQMTTTPSGAGIYLKNCPSVSLSGNTIDGNAGASEGGGIYVNNCSITMNGGVLSYNQTTSAGGGASLIGSDVTLDGVKFLRNSSAVFGGAVGAGDTSAVTIRSCDFMWNSSMIGGGVYADAGDAYIRHNLFVGNNASASSGAFYATKLGAGDFIGNTLDRNTHSGSGSAGLFLNSSGINVFNNIVVNSVGSGIACSGSPLPTLEYNDVWNNSAGDYSGCSGGEGSISSDPLFVDTAAVDYHLAVHSPAIDAGDTSSAYDDPDGSRGDMGWYGSHSFVMDQPSYPKNLIADVITGDVVLTWNRNPEADIQSYAIYCDTISGLIPSIDNFVQFVLAPDTTVNMGAYSDTVYYKISAVDSTAYGSGYSNADSPDAPTAVPDKPLAYQFKLYQNIPNPFNPRTIIKYELNRSTWVTLTIYDVTGSIIKRLVDAIHAPGLYSTEWDGTNFSGQRVSSGIYFYRMSAGGIVWTKKMALLK
ncbi:MAG: T9SS type A sorting domain-containing protein [Candidatus Latescibacteria bacterium]|nr:T9SS type A sorting domain-containing protein [Candidatus Latescibacterota bacterium]NIM64509.1 T9SS type A sorting domain-containing protein [Candidatus Latescibacterota bacterium]NIO00662.1 T9SS type A sorting domain-containing protein [Candidatus Latescibacterota bacterium]NIO27065.1 T9SS type A sorting domain-containing protein [Candidatus Latescibacterota bacterium]NIO54589.1 T9SS type A sorting domain-containing protein [Candidatus Latescibacterota bacterium]